jgi:type II secretory ATPase GspE/PulE/Tfp pilus assembly ATPase PilB-like protein
MRDLISAKASSSVLNENALVNGFCPITEDGMEKVEWGITTRTEVMRVLNI